MADVYDQPFDRYCLWIEQGVSISSPAVAPRSVVYALMFMGMMWGLGYWAQTAVRPHS